MNESNIQKWMKELPKKVSEKVTENAMLPISAIKTIKDNIINKPNMDNETKKIKPTEETIALSKKISYILRHHPEEYDVELDEYGYTSLDVLINSINKKDKENITLQDIINAVNTSDKQRFEIKSDKIRALYGHSKSLVIIKEIGTPPDVLYHGTNEEAYKKIKTEGILPMSRQFVHLSTDIPTAKTVAKRRSNDIVILKVNAKAALEDNVEFFIGNSNTWLVKKIDPKYIERVDNI